MNKNNKKSRIKCLKPNELAYLLLISSVISGCTDRVEKLPNYQEVLEMCQKDPAYCEESKKIEETFGPQAASSSSATGTWDSSTNTYHAPRSSNSFFNYYLMYHLFFARSSSMNSQMYQSKFNNYNVTKLEETRERYRGHGVYTPAFIGRIHNSVRSGDMSFTASNGRIYKSAKFAGSSKSSITGKSISRGGFGSIGRSHGVSS